jgi:hypothetical protein
MPQHSVILVCYCLVSELSSVDLYSGWGEGEVVRYLYIHKDFFSLIPF